MILVEEEKIKDFHFRLSAGQLKRLKKIAKENKLSAGEFLRSHIDSNLNEVLIKFFKSTK